MFIQIQHLLKLNSKYNNNQLDYKNSNTTLVKVKLVFFYALFSVESYSNTTLVKVKFITSNQSIIIIHLIQIQHLLKLNKLRSSFQVPF